MGCCGGNAEWKREEVLDHKFDFIDVREYRDTGIMSQLKYALLYANMAKSVAVYLADIYTAITLLAIGHLTGTLYTEAQKDQGNPLSVSVDYVRWIFTGCIIFSFLLLAYEAHKARAIVRSRDISYAYTNVMANNYYSLNSFDHFCFFNQINNSTKKKDEFAFFIFFTFKGWKRLLVADGPRQVINAFVLFSVAAEHKFTSDVYQYYQGNVLSGVMLITMIFTVVVFAASAFLLAVAALMYIPLIVYIKGNLKEYCCHKIDKRISELVRRKKKSRMARQVALARKEAEGDFSHLRNKKGELVGRAIPQPTLPNVEVDLFSDTESTLNHGGNRPGGGGYPASIIGTDKGGAGGPDPYDYQQQQYYHPQQEQPGYAGSIAGTDKGGAGGPDPYDSYAYSQHPQQQQQQQQQQYGVYGTGYADDDAQETLAAHDVDQHQKQQQYEYGYQHSQYASSISSPSPQLQPQHTSSISSPSPQLQPQHTMGIAPSGPGAGGKGQGQGHQYQESVAGGGAYAMEQDQQQYYHPQQEQPQQQEYYQPQQEQPQQQQQQQQQQQYHQYQHQG
ncbi:unnamed protein product [Tilletia controversa]|uniref:Vacuole protein n=3 Tax=Tilletia TaxID=13289 RepID=A0A8X7MM64_9BASI|nr:hypothetical protein CF328_g6614 [Tilletia controversa]KAE8190149.1 hypothetical protein CF335_g6437 [Tilletia laevis]KAE8258434.1 hypothetical protein A4X03_0g4379 [Tilletia caries]KAE8190809.1 hypothetical protein CF336_g5142 [Tilletia laevis]KAE8241529.1 hypothetical protein A4X06_0g7502 [Tilletia controversa]